jgi:beta-lactamase regulating signal transducer with metallopeptidase domain
MTFALLGIAVALVAFMAAAVVASGALAVLWPAALSAAGRAPVVVRARLLYALRLLPAALGAIAALALASAAWLRFEPRRTAETPGLWLVIASSAGLALILLALVRGVRAWRAGRALERQWTAAGTAVRLPGVSLPVYRIVHPWPVVCVVGTLRPRLFVAEKVLDACTPEELASVLAHEAGHVTAHDNLKRLLAKFLPDVLHWIPAGRALDRAWESAAEAAADARAAAARPGGSLDLAAALLRVARLATAGPWAPLPARALFDGASVAPRVERLLSDEADAPSTVRMVAVWACVLAVPAVLLAASLDPSVLRIVHQAAEALVKAR